MNLHAGRPCARAIVLTLLAFAPAVTASATIYPLEDPVVLEGELADRIQIEGGWRYHPGDDPAWADPALDDSGWVVTSSLLRSSKPPPGGWPGIGWFRRRIELADGMPATAVGLRPMQFGASEVFLDGRLVARFGVVSANSAKERPVYPNDFIGIAVEPGRRHVLAIRYSNSRGNIQGRNVLGFALNLRSVVSAAASYHKWGYTVLTSSAAFSGAFAALAVLHLLLFVLHPASREHLFFAAFSFATSASFALEISIHLTSDLITRLSIYRPYSATTILAVILGLALVHAVVRRRPTWPTWILCVAGAVQLVWVYTWKAFGSVTTARLFLLFAFLEMLRVTLGALRRREAEIWIVAVAFVPMAAVAVVEIAVALLALPLDLSLPVDISMAILALSFSLFISRRAARTSRELDRRRVEVQDLSERAVEQELRAAREEAERKVLEAENARRTHELEAARRLQLAMLPHAPPTVAGFDLAFHMVTATEVGGDYVDLRAGEGTPPLLAVGDATSHGLQAGMVVAVAKSLFQGVDPGDGPLSALDRVGAGLQSMNERHASMAMVVIQVAPHGLRVASAGMPPVLVMHGETREVEELLIPGVPLGTLAGVAYEARDVAIATGDTVLVATDGLAEAVGADGEPFGYPRIIAELRPLAGGTAREVVDGMLAAVTSFLDGGAPQDDITLVALRSLQIPDST